jgi:hypothetical protein
VLAAALYGTTCWLGITPTGLEVGEVETGGVVCSLALIAENIANALPARPMRIAREPKRRLWTNRALGRNGMAKIETSKVKNC